MSTIADKVGNTVKDIYETSGLVFNIEKFHINDGRGIRTVVFLKGCPCSCPWCSNPESKNIQPEIAYYKDKCLKCHICENVCPNGAVEFSEGSIIFNRELCKCCGLCVEKCPNSARELIGKKMSVAEIYNEVEKDIPFYRNSGGGVTLSGGEPAMQPNFSQAILKICRDNMINTVVETSGCVNWTNLWITIEFADEILFDVKQTNRELFGGVSSPISLEVLKKNLEGLVRNEKNVVIRCPLIPGYNDNETHFETVIKWAQEFGIERVDILPFHQFGRKKYFALDIDYKFQTVDKPKQETIEKFKNKIINAGLKVIVGG